MSLSGARRVAVRVLGPPAVIDQAGTAAGGLRRKSGELLVFLSLHPGGVPAAEIIAALWPDVAPHRANQRLSTCLANIRRTIRTCGEAATGPSSFIEPVLSEHHRYRLDPNVINVDLWTCAPQNSNGLWQASAIERLTEHHTYTWLCGHHVPGGHATEDNADGIPRTLPAVHRAGRSGGAQNASR